MSVQRSLSFHAKVYYRPHIVLETNPLLSYSTIKKFSKTWVVGVRQDLGDKFHDVQALHSQLSCGK